MRCSRSPRGLRWRRRIPALEAQQRPGDQREQRQREREHGQVRARREPGGTPSLRSRWRNCGRLELAREARRAPVPRAPGSPRSRGQVERHADQRVALLEAHERLPAVVDRDRLGWCGRRPGPLARAGRPRCRRPCHAVTLSELRVLQRVCRAQRGSWRRPRARRRPARRASARWRARGPSESSGSPQAITATSTSHAASAARRAPRRSRGARYPRGRRPGERRADEAADRARRHRRERPGDGRLGQQRLDGHGIGIQSVRPGPLGGQADRPDQRRRPARRSPPASASRARAGTTASTSSASTR